MDDVLTGPSVFDRLRGKIRRGTQRAFDFLGQPGLAYLETHLTDHCNLNCRGCSHYCPLARPYFADLSQYRSDMQRIGQLFRKVRTIRLMGGEPLLHPDPGPFLTTTRAICPQADIHFVTNGLLLPEASPEFWEACGASGTTIDITVYPPMRGRLPAWRSLCAARGVDLCVTERGTFHAWMNLRGDSSKQMTFARCWRRNFGPFLRDGRLYTCAMSPLVGYFNEWFGRRVPVDQGIDLRSPGVSGHAILQALRRPLETCKWCAADCASFPWSRSHRRLAEWVAGASPASLAGRPVRSTHSYRPGEDPRISGSSPPAPVFPAAASPGRHI